MTLKSLKSDGSSRRAVIVAALLFQAVYFTLRCLSLNLDGPYFAAYSLVVLGAELGLGISLTLVLIELWRPVSTEPEQTPTNETTDVVLVVRDEEIGLVRASLGACERLEEDHQTLVLDLLGRSEVRAAAEEAGVAYFQPTPLAVTRGQALDAALSRLAGDLLAVFDAGMIPETNFLSRTTNQLVDAKVAGVQSSIVAPAVMTDASSYGRVELTPRNADPLSRVRQIGRNSWDASTLDASGFLVRRSAIETIGGFGPEEGETLRASIRLHQTGLSVNYLDEPLCVDFTSMDAVHVLTSNAENKARDFAGTLDAKPWLSRGLSLGQRLCYASTFFQSLSPVFRAVVYLAPIPALALGAFPVASGWCNEIMALALAYHLVASLVRRFVSGGEVRVGSHELNAMAAVWTGCYALFVAVVCRFQRRRDFGRHVIAVSTAGIARPHVVFASATAAAVFWAWMGPTFGVAAPGELIVPTLIALWNAGLSLVAIERILAKWERRRHERRSALLSVQYDVPGEANLGGLGLAFDLSESGLGLVVYHPFNVGQSIFMTLEGPDGRMRLQGEVRSVRRVGGGITPSLERPAAYRVGVLLTRATALQRDLLLHWSALQAARDVKRSLYDESLRNFFERSSLRRHSRRKLHAPMLLGGDAHESDPWCCVTQDIGPTGFRVFSPTSLEKNVELRFAMATPFGPASGWVRLEREVKLTGGSTPILAQDYAFTIWDNGSEAIIRRMASPRRKDFLIAEALSPASSAPKLPMRTYAVAAAVWFLLAAPLLSMSFFHAHSAELLLTRLENSDEAPSPAEREELESYSRQALVAEGTTTRRLEQLYEVLSRVPGRRESTRLAEALAGREPSNPYWRLRWGEGVSTAGLHVDADRRFQEALQFADQTDEKTLATIHVARARNHAAAGNWSAAADSFTQSVFLIPSQTRWRAELASALVRAGRTEEALDYVDQETVAKLSPIQPRSNGKGSKPPESLKVAAKAPVKTLQVAPVLNASVVKSPKSLTRTGTPKFSLNSVEKTTNRLISLATSINGWGTLAPTIRPEMWKSFMEIVDADRQLAQGRFEDARSRFRQLIEQPAFAQAGHAVLRNHLYTGYSRAAAGAPVNNGIIEEARRISTVLLRDEEPTAAALISAADLFDRYHDVVESIALLDRAYRLNPKEVGVAHRLVKALEKTGEYERAGEILKNILSDVAASP